MNRSRKTTLAFWSLGALSVGLSTAAAGTVIEPKTAWEGRASIPTRVAQPVLVTYDGMSPLTQDNELDDGRKDRRQQDERERLPRDSERQAEDAKAERSKVTEILEVMERDDRGGDKEDGRRARLYREHARDIKLRLGVERRSHEQMMDALLDRLVDEAATGRLERVDLLLRLADEEVERHQSIVAALLSELRSFAPDPRELRDRRQEDRRERRERRGRRDG